MNPRELHHVRPVRLTAPAIGERPDPSWRPAPDPHITVFAGDRLFERAVAAAADEETAFQRLVAALLEARSAPLRLTRVGPEVRRCEKDGRASVVVMCQVAGLDELYRRISQRIDVDLETPAAHVTLFVRNGETGIELEDPKALLAYSQVVDPDSAEPFLRIEVELVPVGSRFDRALRFASDIHSRQRRRGGEVPYLAHLMGVSSLVLEDGGSEEEAIGGLLHDSVEDHPGEVSIERLEREFGPAVAAIVRVCTDTFEQPKPPWEERKRRYVEHLGDPRNGFALRVAAADKLYNARAILGDYRVIGDELWARFDRGADAQLWYYRSLADALGKAFPGRLVDELDRTVTELERAVAAGS